MINKKNVMVNQQITKEDLRLVNKTIIRESKDLLTKQTNWVELDWVKGKIARQLLNICPASLQTLRITCKLRYRKVVGSYYYNRKDIEKLFSE